MNGAGGDVECKLVSPSGREDDCFITPLAHPGEHSVRFVPKEEGTHYLHAKLNGIHIPGSPFKLVVVDNLNNAGPRGAGGVGSGGIGGLDGAGGNPTDVSVHGSGIEGGVTGTPSHFIINTTDVGAGTLSITVDGPSKVDLACTEVDDGCVTNRILVEDCLPLNNSLFIFQLRGVLHSYGSRQVLCDCQVQWEQCAWVSLHRPCPGRQLDGE